MPFEQRSLLDICIPVSLSIGILIMHGRTEIYEVLDLARNILMALLVCGSQEVTGGPTAGALVEEVEVSDRYPIPSKVARHR